LGLECLAGGKKKNKEKGKKRMIESVGSWEEDPEDPT